MKTNIKTNPNVSKVLNKLVSVMSLSVALLSVPHTVSAAVLTGGATYFYRSSNGTTSPIFLDLGSGLASTGEISYSLDPTNPNNSTFSFDFDTQSVQVELDYLVDFPLLEQIGKDPIKLNLSETGSIINQVPDVPVGQTQNITFQALVLGTRIFFSDPDWYCEDLSVLLSLGGQGQLKPLIYEVFPLSRVAEAHHLLGQSQVIGKIVLVND